MLLPVVNLTSWVHRHCSWRRLELASSAGRPTSGTRALEKNNSVILFYSRTRSRARYAPSQWDGGGRTDGAGDRRRAAAVPARPCLRLSRRQQCAAPGRTTWPARHGHGTMSIDPAMPARSHSVPLLLTGTVHAAARRRSSASSPEKGRGI